MSGVTSPAAPEKGFRYRLAPGTAPKVDWTYLYRWEWVDGQCPRRYGWVVVYEGPAVKVMQFLNGTLLAPGDTVEIGGVVYGFDG